MTNPTVLPQPVTSSGIILSDDQENALQKFVTFLLNPDEQVFVFEGYAGTGKSTLIHTLMERLPKYIKTAKLINPQFKELEVQLTATTNKAAESFARVTGLEVRTIHSFLGLRVHRDHMTGKSELIPKSREPERDYLLFIDEASYIDRKLLSLIFRQTSGCKIVFIGDPAQLTPVMSTETPVFNANFTTVKLTKVMRQAEGNPIIELATQFRETVRTGQWSRFTPDQKTIIHLPRDEFEDAILAEFVRPDWRYLDSKVLAWRNEAVIGYNHAINSHLTGDPNFAVDDYVVCNKHVSSGKQSIKTDEMVLITCIEPLVEELGVMGNFITVNYALRFFCPKSLAAKNERIKEAKAMNDYCTLRTIDENWIDLRAAFAQTVNKSQGSTYGEVYLDLTDIGRCTSGDQIARMMYVAVSRARNRVFMTGDFG